MYLVYNKYTDAQCTTFDSVTSFAESQCGLSLVGQADFGVCDLGVDGKYRKMICVDGVPTTQVFSTACPEDGVMPELEYPLFTCDPDPLSTSVLHVLPVCSETFPAVAENSCVSVAVDEYDEYEYDDDEDCEDLLTQANASPDHMELVLAVLASGIWIELANGGPFTVFAPDNTAFNEAELDMADTKGVSGILKHHVFDGVMTIESLREVAQSLNNKVRTLNNDMLVVSLDADGNILLDGQSKVVGEQQLACDGVIHFIDKVILPKDSDEDKVVETAKETTLEFLLAEGMIMGTLLKDVPLPETNFTYTLLAPNNIALMQRSDLQTATEDEQTRLASYHILPSPIVLGEPGVTKVDTFLEGTRVEFNVTESGEMYVNGAKITGANVMTAEGVVHVIDQVLTPPDVVVSEAPAPETNTPDTEPTAGAGAEQEDNSSAYISQGRFLAFLGGLLMVLH